METIFDWISVAIFAGLVGIFLQRSIGARPENDRVLNYLPPAIGCAVGNYLGNHSQTVLAVLMLALVIGYIALVIRPSRRDLPK